MKRSLTCLLAIILILAGTAGAAGGATTCIGSATSDDTGAIAMAFIALTLSFDVIAIGYIFSKIFPGSGIKEWIATEYWEVTKTALLIVGIYAALSLLGNMAAMIAPPAIVTAGGSGITVASTSADFTGLTSLSNGACSYLNYEATFADKSINYFTGASESLGLLWSLFIKFNVEIPISAVPPITYASGFVMQPYQNKMLLSGPQFVGSDYQSIINDMWLIIVMPVSVAIEGQLSLIPLLFAVGLGALIPMGLILRAIPFVRGVGGTFIAIGVGLALVYPSTLVLLNYPVTVALQGSAISVPPQASQTCTGDWLVCGLMSSATTLLSAVTAPAGLGTVVGDYYGDLTSIFPTLNGVLYYGTYMLMQLFLFILDLAITITLVDNLTNMLGGKLITSIGKLRLA